MNMRNRTTAVIAVAAAGTAVWGAGCGLFPTEPPGDPPTITGALTFIVTGPTAKTQQVYIDGSSGHFEMHVIATAANGTTASDDHVVNNNIGGGEEYIRNR
jgi:hypothetical protein